MTEQHKHVCALLPKDIRNLGNLLSTPWGRELYYALTIEIGGLMDDPWDGGIKDGICLDRHIARDLGRRSYAVLLKDEALAHFPDLWMLMLHEQIDTRIKTQPEEISQ